MAIIYCNDDGSNTAPHETWAKAATTFLVAVDAAAAGDDIYIGADHAEDPGTNVVYAFPGTDAAPNRVVSVTVDTTTYNKADNIQIDNSAAARDITITGHVKFYGISIKLGDDLLANQTGSSIMFDDSVLELSRANGGQVFIGTTNAQQFFGLKNTNLNFSGGGALSAINLIGIGFVWEGGTLTAGGTTPSRLFNAGDRDNVIRISGVNMSDWDAAIFDVGDACRYTGEVHHCLLNASTTLAEGTISDSNTRVLMSGCDDTTGNDLYRFEYVDYYGSIVHDDNIFRTTGGASDGTTPISLKMVTTANAAEFSEPLISQPIVIWNDTTGSRTFTIQCLWDSVTDIQNDEIWAEFEYLSASADTESDLANDGLANILASPADQTTNATAWTESLTNDNEFELSVTVTVNRVGPVIARVHLGKPSTTVYVDPKITAS